MAAKTKVISQAPRSRQARVNVLAETKLIIYLWHPPCQAGNSEGSGGAILYVECIKRGHLPDAVDRQR